MLRTNPVAHETPATAWCRLRISRPSKNSFPKGVFFPGKSVNDILYIWESTSLISNAVTTRSASKKRKIVEIYEDDVEDVNSHSGSETLHPNTQPIGEAAKLTNFRFPPIGERESPSFSSPLSIVSSTRQTTLLLSKSTQASSSHASTTTLRKLLYIKSTHDSTHCVICIRSKQIRKPFLPSTSKVSRKLERIHSNICGPFPTSNGMTKLLLTFHYLQWCWIATIDDQSSGTGNREFRMLIKQIEPQLNRLFCRIYKH